jgi:hypothetical protein
MPVGEFLLVGVVALTIGIGAATGCVPIANGPEPTVGDPPLAAHWVDPDFNPAERAFALRSGHRVPDAALARPWLETVRHGDGR